MWNAVSWAKNGAMSCNAVIILSNVSSVITFWSGQENWKSLGRKVGESWKTKTSMPVISTGVYCHTPFPLRLHSQRWLTRRSVIPASLSYLVRDCPMRYQHFSLFSLGANPWARVHQNEDDLLPTQIYPPVKFHRPVSTHAGDIHYKKIADGQTNKAKGELMPIGTCKWTTLSFGHSKEWK